VSNENQRQRENQKRRAAVTAAQNNGRRTRILVYGGLAVLVVVAVIVALVVSGNGSDAQASQTEQAPVKVTGSPLPSFQGDSSNDPAIGDTIPTLQGVSVFDGTPVEIKPDGKPQAVVFVAHWCPHCQAEVPRLVTLAKSGAFKGVEVTAVATGTNSGYPNYPPSAWLKRVNWPFPVMADSKNYAAANAYGLSAYPYFVLVDADGKVAARASGEVSDTDIIANVKALKAGQPLPLLKSGASSSSS
jgi:thiol-disulfide isomerase/thioredoxin